MSANNKILKSIQLLTEKGIEQGIKSIFPVRFHSYHTHEETRNNSWIIIIGGTFYLLMKLLLENIKNKRFCVKTEYQILFYAPNSKYKRFVDSLTKDASFSYLVISEENFSTNVLSVNDFNILKSKKHPLKLSKTLFILFLQSLKTNQLNDFKKYYWNILSLVRRDLIADALFQHTTFSKYFSFHPAEGFHQVIQNFYKSKFKETYAIRPTTTSMAEEHRFISTENLFYKTDDELDVYNHSNLKPTKLLKGGLIGEAQPLKIPQNNSGILFLDTCTNVNPESIDIRRKAVSQFLEYVSRLNANVYFKFHPALIKTEIKITENQIISLANPKIKILDTDIPWEKIKMAIGFDTTLFYDCFMHRIPVLSFQKDYNLFPNIINEFTKSPIIPINTKLDFENISRLLNDEILWEKYKTKQFQWFSNKYNYPEGMNTIKRILSK